MTPYSKAKIGALAAGAGMMALASVGIAQEPDIEVRFRVNRLERPIVDNAIVGWMAKPKEVANTMLAKYGEPNEASAGRLIWWNNGPWHFTELENVEIPHHWPKPHSDMLYQAIPYNVPVDKFDDLAAFDGSVIAERTRGWLGARCDKEEANFLAVNLAHDIITNRRSVSGARDFYAKAMSNMMSGTMNEEQRRYTSSFTFPVSSMQRGDRDMMHGEPGYVTSYSTYDDHDRHMDDDHDRWPWWKQYHFVSPWDRHWDSTWQWRPHGWRHHKNGNHHRH
jgi:hypothetical protein